MKPDAVDTLAKVVGCPRCQRRTALGYYESVHFRYCLYCNLSYTVVYNTRSKTYKRGKVVKGNVWLNS